MSSQLFKGAGVAIITPFDEEGNVDFESLKLLLETFMSKEGPDFLTVNGTTAESATLEDSEKVAILQFVKEHNTAKKPIMYGIGGNNTAKVLKTIKETDFTDVQAILSVCPYYNKPSQEGIYQHYVAIADASPVPVMLYNIPGRTGVNMTVNTIVKLSHHKNIFGIKEASGDLTQAAEIKRQTGDDFVLSAGDDLLAVPMISLGAIGSISVLSNLYPKKYATMLRLANAGNFEAARKHLFDFMEINPLLYAEGNPVGAKYVLSELDIIENYVRLPLVSASADLQYRLKQAMGRLSDEV